MFIYHYSKEHYPLLKCKALQRVKTDSEELDLAATSLDQNNLPYDRSISFLMEPAPLDILGGIYGKEHATWAPGTALWEHKVDTDFLWPLIFSLVESVEAMAYFYDPKNDKLSDKKFMEGFNAITAKHGYIGTDSHKLNALIKANLGNTRKCYEQVKSRSNFEDLKLKYAGSVPHLMLYPRSGWIKPISARQVTVAGLGTRTTPKYADRGK